MLYLLFASVSVGAYAQRKNKEELIGRDASAIQVFVLYNYRSLIMDLAEGRGEYLDALLRLCRTPESDKKLVTESIRRALLLEQDKFNFAREVANRYDKHSTCD